MTPDADTAGLRRSSRLNKGIAENRYGGGNPGNYGMGLHARTQPMSADAARQHALDQLQDVFDYPDSCWLKDQLSEIAAADRLPGGLTHDTVTRDIISLRASP